MRALHSDGVPVITRRGRVRATTRLARGTLVAAAEERGGRHAVHVVPGEHLVGQLVGGHHDGRVGDLAHELRCEAAVEAPPSLFLVDDPQGLPEGRVLVTLFAHARTGHLVWIGNNRGTHFGQGGRPKVRGLGQLIRRGQALCSTVLVDAQQQARLELLVHDELR